MKKELLQAGKIVNTHALRGDLRIYPYCDGPDFLCNVKKIYIDDVAYPVVSAKVHKGQALVHLKGIDHINLAEPLVGKIVYLKKSEVPLETGRFFIDDIIGLTVVDVDTDVVYGKVTDVISTGANDVFEVTGEKTLLVPKIDEVVLDIDLENEKILIRPLQGLFE